MRKPTHLIHKSQFALSWNYNVTFAGMNVDIALFFKQQYAMLPFIDYQYAH